MISLPVLWLSGPPGVGKTTVAWELFERLGRQGLAVGCVDIDQLGMCPEPAGDPGRYRVKARALAAVAANFRDAGAQCLVVPGVTDPGREIEPVPNTELTTCRLRADPAELTRRITGRGGMTDLAEALEHAEAVDLAPGAWVDTTGLSVREVADRVLHRTGWPRQATSMHAGDGQELIGARMIATVRCAPPANKPTPTERDTCAPWVQREVALVAPSVRVVVALGAYGWAAALRALSSTLVPAPRFGHAAEVGVGDLTLLGCYHPSQHNTFTGRLTPEMLDRVFERARVLTD